MNVILIHGDNNIKSYERFLDYLNKAKKNGFDVINFDDKNKLDAFRSYGLFNNKRIISVRNYNLIDNKVIDYINKSDSNYETIIYHDNIIPQAFIKNIKNIRRNEVYRLSKHLWKFIDNFYPGNSKILIYQLNESVKYDPIELIFSILSSYLKDVYLISNSNRTFNYPPWRINKLKNISEKFGKIKLIKVINDLANIDIKIKTTNASLKDELDLFILRKLE